MVTKVHLWANWCQYFIPLLYVYKYHVRKELEAITDEDTSTLAPRPGNEDIESNYFQIDGEATNLVDIA